MKSTALQAEKVSSRQVLKNGFRSPGFVSLALTAVLYILTYLRNVPVFFINDDTNIAYTLAGFYTGSPADHPFVNFTLSSILRLFYSIFPHVPWYGLYQSFSVFLSIWAIFYGICLLQRFSRTKAIVTIPLLILVYAAFFYYPTELIQFTTTSALLGAAGLVMFLIYFLNDRSRLIKSKYFWFGILFILFSYITRKNNLLVILAFLAVFIFTRLVMDLIQKKNFKAFIRQSAAVKKTAAIGLALIIGLGACYGINAIGRSSEGWKNYYAFDTARFHFQDYPRDSYQENPELYTEAGWSESLSNLVGTPVWSNFLLDENINETSLDMLSGQTENPPIMQRISNSLKSLWAEGFYVKFSVVYVLSVLVYALLLCLNKRNLSSAFTLMMLVLVFGAGLVYLCLIQRIPLRAYQALFFQFLSLSLCVVSCTTGAMAKKFFKNKQIILTIIILIGSVLVFWKTDTKVSALVESRRRNNENILKVEEYALLPENKDNLYIYDTSLTFRYLPFQTYDEQPTNVMFWGGMGWKSPAYYEQLQANGYDEINTDVFFDQDVYYVTKPDLNIKGRPVMDFFMDYINQTYGENGKVVTEKVADLDNNIQVYKLKLEK